MRVRFDDTKDERRIAMDDGFEVIEVDEPKEGATTYEVNGHSYRFKIWASKSLIKKSPKKKGKVIDVTRARISKEIKLGDSEIRDKETEDKERKSTRDREIRLTMDK